MKKLSIVAILYAAVCLLSGSVNWLFQFAVVAFLGVAVISYTFRYISRAWYHSLLVVLPFYLVYIPASLYFGSRHTYPIWILGIMFSMLAYVLLLNKTRLPYLLLFFAAATALNLVFVIPNYYAYLASQVTLEQYALDKFNLYDRQGRNISREELKGKIVLLDIWHTACRPCIENFPRLETLYRKYQDDSTVVIGVVNIPIERKDDKALADRYTREYHFKQFFFRNSMDAKMLHIESVPFVLIFDQYQICRYAGSLQYGSTVFIGNVERIIQKLQRKK